MSYLVMESKAGYAVVLDNQGRFQKVPNLGYEVGETLDYVTIFPEETVVTPFRKKMASLVAAAACFLMLFIGSHQFLLTTYGTVRIQINPDVLLGINRLDYVIDLKGMNEDGVRLVEGYRYKGKRLESVSEELADLAMEEGYLKDGGEIVLTVESKHEKWRADKETVLTEKISTHLEKRASVKVSAGGTDRTDGAGDGDWQHGSQNGQTTGTPVNGTGNGNMRNPGDRTAEDYDDDDGWDDDRDDADDDWDDADDDWDDADDDQDDVDDDRDDADDDRDGADDDRDGADDDRDDADDDRDGADDDQDDADDDRDDSDDSRDGADDGWKDTDRSRKDADDDRDDADDHQNEVDGGRDDADDKHNGPGVARTIRAEQIDSGDGADHRNDADAGSSGEYNNHDREDSNHDDMDDDYDEEDNSDDSSDDHRDDGGFDDSDQDDDD